jgi:hypothetical protein
MLLSHRHAFIYLKTFKTAGTSVEIYFETACLPDDHPYEETHYRAEIVTSTGVIGQRDPQASTASWFNHMPAVLVREQVGPDWDRYLKFCCVRDPYDKVVSAFWMRLDTELRQTLASAPFETVRACFQDWIAVDDLPDDRAIYTIDGRLIVDDVIRYERLVDDLRRICERLGMTWAPARLKRYKGEFRVRPEPFADYYDATSRDQVGRAYDREFEWFGYARQP